MADTNKIRNGAHLTSSTPPLRKGLIAICWIPYEQRTERFAAHLGAELHMIHYLRKNVPLIAPIKYVIQFFHTAWILIRRRPKVIWVTSPPFVAVLPVYLYCVLSGARYVMDTEPPALYHPRWQWSAGLVRFFARQAMLNITDQEQYAARLIDPANSGPRPVVLRHPEIVIQIERCEKVVANQVIVINTFNYDEPLDCVLEAARLVEDVEFQITGDLSKAPAGILESAPDNVTFTGYLTGDDYWRVFDESAVVIVLTDEPTSLTMGSEEGLAMHKPMVLSDQPTLREHYPLGVSFVDHTGKSIAEGVTAALEDWPRLSADMKAQSQAKDIEWRKVFEGVQTTIDEALSARSTQ